MYITTLSISENVYYDPLYTRKCILRSSLYQKIYIATFSIISENVYYGPLYIIKRYITALSISENVYYGPLYIRKCI